MEANLASSGGFTTAGCDSASTGWGGGGRRSYCNRGLISIRRLKEYRQRDRDYLGNSPSPRNYHNYGREKGSRAWR